MIARPRRVYLQAASVTGRARGGSTGASGPRTERRAGSRGYRLHMVAPRAAVVLLLLVLVLLAGCGGAAVDQPSVMAGRSIVPVEQFPAARFRGRCRTAARGPCRPAGDRQCQRGRPHRRHARLRGVRRLGRRPAARAGLLGRDAGRTVHDVPRAARLGARGRRHLLPRPGRASRAHLFGKRRRPRPGCPARARAAATADDFANVPAGAIVVTTKGGCLRRQQVVNAAAHGALALLFVYPDRGPGKILRPTLISPDGIDIPAVAVTAEAGRTLTDAAGHEAHHRRHAPSASRARCTTWSPPLARGTGS